MSDILSTQSKKEQTAVGSSFTIRGIPIERIMTSPDNQYGIRDIEELAASIEAMGLLHNLVVKEANEDGYYELVSGERRYHACKLLYEGGNEAYATVPCKVETNNSTTEAELKLLYANATARVLTDYEKTIQAVRIKELLLTMKAEGYVFKGRMREIVARMLDVSSAQIGRMESISKKLSPELTEAFKSGKIGITTAYELSTLHPDAQAGVLRRYQETGTFEWLEAGSVEAAQTQDVSRVGVSYEADRAKPKSNHTKLQESVKEENGDHGANGRLCRPKCNCIIEQNRFLKFEGNTKITSVAYEVKFSVDIQNGKAHGRSSAILPLRYCPCCGEPYDKEADRNNTDTIREGTDG